MFNKVTFLIVIFALSVSSMFAQTDQNSEEIQNFEIYAGATLTKDFTNDFNQNAFGAEGAFVKNLNRFVGIKAKGDFSIKTDKFTFPIELNNSGLETPAIKVRTTDYNFLGGIQIKDNRKEGSRLRPFAHALVGVGINNTKVEFNPAILCGKTKNDCLNLSETNVGVSSSFGGGLDIKVNDRISVRAIQVDYNPRHFSEEGFQHNIRFGAGIVFH